MFFESEILAAVIWRGVRKCWTRFCGGCVPAVTAGRSRWLSGDNGSLDGLKAAGAAPRIF